MTRIIAGSHGGRRLRTPAGDKTRPTTDRAREAVFSALTAWAGELTGVGLLDLYAGSGAIALEAASRGCAPVLAVEQDRRTADLIRANACDLDLPVQVRTGDAAAAMAEPAPRAYDILWLDPPYELATERAVEVIRSAWQQGWLVADGIIALERDRRSSDAPQWPAEVPVGEQWSKRYGETEIHYAMLDKDMLDKDTLEKGTK